MDGYFVVSMSFSNELLVVPANWIHGIQAHIEKFFDNGLNTTQEYLCYWNIEGMGDLEPRNDFQPNFNANVSDEFPVDEACFIVRMMKYKSK